MELRRKHSLVGMSVAFERYQTGRIRQPVERRIKPVLCIGLICRLQLEFNGSPTMLDHIPIGTNDENWYQDNQPIFTISPDTRRKHVAIFGATGAGKSTLLRNMIAWDISAGAGVTVVDPHGQLVDDILNHHVPSSRAGDVIYFNPKDPV